MSTPSYGEPLMRQLPDVAAAADPWSGWDVYTGGDITVAGGTSAATPFWAASMASLKPVR